MVEIFPGVFAELYGFRQGEANMQTASVMNHSQNPHAVGDPRLEEGLFIGMHFDKGENLSVRERIEEPRRLVVNMTPGTVHYLLFVPEYNVFDLATLTHPREYDYIPKQAELYIELAYRTEAAEPRAASVIWTPLAYGEAVLLPAYTIYLFMMDLLQDRKQAG